MDKVFFYMMPSIEFDLGKPLHLSHVITSYKKIKEAVDDFNLRYKSRYETTYTAGHYGEPDHEWVFSHHEIYEPKDPNLSAMVILRYKPALSI